MKEKGADKMAYTKSRYTAEQNHRWTVEAMVVLSEAKEAMTCEQIRMADLDLLNVTPQKMSRILNDLVEGGFVMKTKAKSGLMKYKSVSVMLEQGYNPTEVIC